MAIQGSHIELMDFSGGLNSFEPEFRVGLNQAIDLDNINLFKRGWEKRQGDTAFNGTAMIDSTTVITGLHYMKFNSGTEFLNAVAGAKFFTSSGLTGTMADKTGGITISAGKDKYWTGVSFNNLQIWFGGTPNAPFKHDGGGGNAAALGGSPPSATTAFVSNNRVFAMNTAADPSIIQWPILSNPEDWTGTGSGNTQASKNDGEGVQFGVPLGNNLAIIFKNSSTHKFLLDAAPFPLFQLQKGVGAAGSRSYVVVDGVIYFITPARRMKATTDGAQFISFPRAVDDKWDNINTSRIAQIVGAYDRRFQQIRWYFSDGSSTTNNRCIVWDLAQKTWLQRTTGANVNTVALVQNRRIFSGNYDGKAYEHDVANTNTDASNSSATIDAFWRSAWIVNQTLGRVIHPRWIDVGIQSRSSGAFTVSYGFDYNKDQRVESHKLTTGGATYDSGFKYGAAKYAGETSIYRRTFVSGRGNAFNVRVRNNDSVSLFKCHGMTIPLRDIKDRKKLGSE